MDYELYHHGVKGQKWGVRRYQNKDGSLTPAGKKRQRQDYASEAKKMTDDELRSKINRMRLESRYVNLSKNSGSKSGKVFDTIDKATSAGSSGSNVAKNVSKMAGKDAGGANVAGQGMNLLSKSASAAKKVSSISSEKKWVKNNKSKLESMSDSDLKKAVDRMDLEQQYSSLRGETVSRGKVSASQALSIAGDVLAIGASATAIALSIYKLKKK